MSLRPLIKKQKIRIDAHQRGNGHIDHWDKAATDIHIDKRTNTKVKGKEVEAILRVPINSSRQVSCEVNRTSNEIAGRKIRKEVLDAFSNDKVRRAFIEDLLDELNNYPTNFTSERRITETLERLAKHFGLTGKTIKKIFEDHHHKLKGVVLRYVDEDGKTYFISANEDEIIVGEATSSDNENEENLINW